MTDEEIVKEVRKLYMYESMMGNNFKAQAYSFTADMLEMIVDIPQAIEDGDIQSKELDLLLFLKLNNLLMKVLLTN